MRKDIFLSALVVVSLSACSTITINPEGHSILVNKPTYKESKPFYFLGLAGEHHIDVLKICGNQEPIQMQAQKTFFDSVATLFTLGIYAPYTAKVWCPGGES